MPQVTIAPSILAADLLRLGEELSDVERAGADCIHVDIMDGRFVPNMFGGPNLVKAIRQGTRLPLDVHLMIEPPEPHIRAFCEAGADTLGVHVEACRHLQATLASIRSFGKRVSVTLSPHTSEETLRYVIGEVDQVLVMLVNPGFGGQDLLRPTIEKISRVRSLSHEMEHGINIAVDGGVTDKVAGELRRAGADFFVTGSFVFHAADRAQAIAAVRQAAVAG